MAEDILVFAGKRVGRELVSYLLDIDAPVRRVIVGTSDDRDILDLLNAKQVPGEIYSNQTQSRLIEEGHRYEWLLNLWGPHILRPSTLDLANHRLNAHPSLVPHCRGSDCAAWTIRKQLPAGVTLMEMREEVDVGEVYAQKEVPYSYPTPGRELHALLQPELVALFKESWPAIFSGAALPKPQTGPVSHHTRRQTNQDRVLDGSDPATLEELVRWILAHDFYPGTTAEMRSNGRIYKLSLMVEEKH
jgi:methionyl-tRNA formyltransferase